ncbi:MAG: hypothetical protein JXA30_07540 [Deltaproteobacteria bacterium]|nr:hypothetical protein [Deltaproteobacteria bacterium]
MATIKKTPVKKQATAKKAVGKRNQGVASKAARGKTAKRTTRPQKRPGSPQTRRMVEDIGKRILTFCKGHTPNEVAAKLGLDAYDVKNLRAGNLPSLDMVLKMVANGRYSPESIIYGKTLGKLDAKVSTKSAKTKLINERVRKLAASKPAQEWGKATGLAVHSIYQLRVSGARAGLHTVLGFLNAGVSIEELFYGLKSTGKK